MNKSLVAFLLAGLTSGILFACFNCMSAIVFSPDGIVISTDRGVDVAQAADAINGLGLKGVVAEPISHANWSPMAMFWSIVSFTIMFIVATGFVLFFYKLFCRWLGAAPHL